MKSIVRERTGCAYIVHSFWLIEIQFPLHTQFAMWTTPPWCAMPCVAHQSSLLSHSAQLATLKKKVATIVHLQMGNPLGNYVRAQRKRAGLSQRELASLLGYDDEGPVSRHEASRCIPPLLVALGYEAVFRSPVSKIFAGLTEAVDINIEKRIREFEQALLQPNQGGSKPSITMDRKLDWIKKRHAASG